MNSEKLEKPIYINIMITTKAMAEALKRAKENVGIPVSTILIKKLIFDAATKP